MKADVKWYVPGRVLYTYDCITAEDMLKRNQLMAELVSTEGQPPSVHIIIDYASTGGGNYAMGLREMLLRASSSEEFVQAREALTQHPLFGWVVSVGIRNPKIKTGGAMMGIKNRYRRHEADSLKEAHHFLVRVDQSLAQLLPMIK